jgi:peptide/nickel transport system substrate-binding protein
VRRPRRWRTFVAVGIVLSVALLAGCTGGGGSDSTDKAGGSSTGSTGPIPKGGTLVVGAEQEPTCADWVSVCAWDTSWGTYAIQEHTIPRTFDFERQNGQWTEVPSILLVREPTVTLVGGKQTVTYSINPAAVWSDGEPITSTDFKYTWDQVVNGENIYDTTGYNQIESIDDTDPTTAVVTFAQPYAAWKTLWGALYGILPSHILAGQDRSAAMTNGYDWSGGPWIAEWEKGVQVALTPNPNWYGKPAKLDRVVFEFQADTETEFENFRDGETMAIYPQPELQALQEVQRGFPRANSFFTAETSTVEAVWINNAREPFTSKAVRQAFAYAIDRDAIVKRLFGVLGVTKAVNTINPPIQRAYSDPTAWSKYTRNLAQVNTLMTGDGWTKNGDGIWQKNERTASFTIKSTAGSARRRLTETLLARQLKSAGFEMTIANQPAAELFGTTLISGDYEVALYAQVATGLQPGLCAIFCSVNIPTPANDFRGQNWQRVSTAADAPLNLVATSLDDAARRAAGSEADQILAEEQVSLPLDPLPNVLLWSKRIVGPVQDDPVLGMFANVHEWGLKKKAK